MFENYTEAAKRVVSQARLAAAQTGMAQISARHLLLGWLKSPADPVEEAMAVRVRRKVFETFPPAAALSNQGDIPLTRDAWQALSDADRLRARHRCPKVDLAHVLWGLTRNVDRESAVILAEEGIHADWVERLLVEAKGTNV